MKLKITETEYSLLLEEEEGEITGLVLILQKYVRTIPADQRSFHEQKFLLRMQEEYLAKGQELHL